MSDNSNLKKIGVAASVAAVVAAGGGLLWYLHSQYKKETEAVVKTKKNKKSKKPSQANTPLSSSSSGSNLASLPNKKKEKPASEDELMALIQQSIEITQLQAMHRENPQLAAHVPIPKASMTNAQLAAKIRELNPSTMNFNSTLMLMIAQWFLSYYESQMDSMMYQIAGQQAPTIDIRRYTQLMFSDQAQNDFQFLYTMLKRVQEHQKENPNEVPPPMPASSFEDEEELSDKERIERQRTLTLELLLDVADRLFDLEKLRDIYNLLDIEKLYATQKEIVEMGEANQGPPVDSLALSACFCACRLGHFSVFERFVDILPEQILASFYTQSRQFPFLPDFYMMHHMLQESKLADAPIDQLAQEMFELQSVRSTPSSIWASDAEKTQHLQKTFETQMDELTDEWSPIPPGQRILFRYGAIVTLTSCFGTRVQWTGTLIGDKLDIVGVGLIQTSMNPYDGLNNLTNRLTLTRMTAEEKQQLDKEIEEGAAQRKAKKEAKEAEAKKEAEEKKAAKEESEKKPEEESKEASSEQPKSEEQTEKTEAEKTESSPSEAQPESSSEQPAEAVESKEVPSESTEAPVASESPAQEEAKPAENAEAETQAVEEPKKAEEETKPEEEAPKSEEEAKKPEEEEKKPEEEAKKSEEEEKKPEEAKKEEKEEKKVEDDKDVVYFRGVYYSLQAPFGDVNSIKPVKMDAADLSVKIAIDVTFKLRKLHRNPTFAEPENSISQLLKLLNSKPSKTADQVD